MKRFALLLLLAVLTVLPALQAEAPARAQPDPRRAAVPAHVQRGVPEQTDGQVVVVGVPGLLWEDVRRGALPALDALRQEGSVGALSVKAGPAVSCPDDGWLTLSAGSRASAFGSGLPGCRRGTGSARQLVQRNESSVDGAQVTSLVDSVRRAGRCVQLAGSQPITLPATLADSGGQDLAVTPQGLVQPPSLTVGSMSSRACDVTLVAAPPASCTSPICALALPETTADGVVRQQAARRRPQDTLLVVGLSETVGADAAHLHVAVAVGPAFPPGALRSPTTGRDGYVQLIDVAPTVLDALGLPLPDDMDGRGWQHASDPVPLPDLVDLDRLAVAQKGVTVPWFVLVLVLELVSLLALLRRPRAAAAAGLAGAAAPAASFLAGLVPWWRSEHPLPALLAVTAVLTAALTAGALLGPWRRSVLGPLAAVLAATAAVVLGDLLTGARLQISSVAGYSPLVAGRFAGIGNVAFGVLVAGAVLGTACATAGRSRRTVLLLVGAAGLVTVVVDGAPPFGSDVGGVLALVPAFVLLALLLTGTRVSVVRLGLAGLAGAAVVTAFALADAARAEADQTHLGRFVHQVADGTAGQVLHRKAAAVLRLLFHSPVTALLPLVVVAFVLLFLRPPGPLRRAFDAAPAYRLGLLALGAACAVGFAVNDSGAAVPALALVVVLPATASLVLRVQAMGPGPAPPRRSPTVS